MNRQPRVIELSGWTLWVLVPAVVLFVALSCFTLGLFYGIVFYDPAKSTPRETPRANTMHREELQGERDEKIRLNGVDHYGEVRFKGEAVKEPKE